MPTPIPDADSARADRIRSARERLGWSQSQLARSLKVSPQAVQNWEKGGGVRSHTQARLAKSLQVPIEVLMFGQSEHPASPPEELSREENLLLLAYRALSSRDKTVAIRVLKALSLGGR